jgi:hypothetical protein
MPKIPEITTLRVCGKTSDMCFVAFVAADNEVVAEHDGYVPDFFPGQHWGDYLELDIDVKTGRIMNWPKIKKAQIDKFLREKKLVQ